MYLPNETKFTEVKAFDNELTKLSNRITSIKSDIKKRETLRNEANIIKARHTGYQSQAIYDEADIIYHAEGKAIGSLTRELQPLELKYGEIYKERGVILRDLLQRDAQSQYESETVKGNLAKIVRLSNAIIEQDAKLNKLNIELTALDKIANDQNECEAGHDRYKAEYLDLKQELEQAEAAYTLDASMPNPIGLRKRVAETKKKYDYTVKHLPSQVLLDSIAEKRCILLGEVTSIEAERKVLKIERNIYRSLIEQIQFKNILGNLLSCLKTMIACDDMTEGQSVIGLDLFEHLKTNGICKPTALGPAESHFVLDGLLDNLDEVKQRINDSFEYDLEEIAL